MHLTPHGGMSSELPPTPSPFSSTPTLGRTLMEMLSTKGTKHRKHNGGDSLILLELVKVFEDQLK